VKFSYGPARGAMMPVAVCTATYSKQHPYYVHIVADGSPALDMPCAGKRDFTHPEHAMFIAYEEPVTSVIGNIDFGQANFGSKMTMEAWISEGLHGPITKVPGARVGVAVYAHDPHMLRTHGLYVARQIVVHDHTYALAAHVFKNLTTRGDVTLRLPSPPARLDVVGGVGAWSSGFRVTGMTGYHTSQPRAITSAMSFDFEQPGPGTRTETIAISGKPDSSGFLYLLAYRRID
jgi:hypothetical protein